ncbi:MAG TPA: hypothetical protein VN282_20000 [Pyrinomonadaceae bacterium]|nr:hypothetical protein [Pyrinomonadaceae bacterium]
MEALIWVGGKAAEKAFDVIKDKVLGIEYQDITVEDWAKTAALAIFAGGGLRPELSDEKKTQLRLDELQRQIDEVKKDIDELRLDMDAFKWKVAELFDEAAEKELWREVINLDSTLDSYYKQLKNLNASSDDLAAKRADALRIAQTIVTNLDPEVEKARTRLLGGQISGVHVKGFLDVWRNQALREADMGWDNQRLAKIYNLLESKFTRALLTQLRCVRLMMEAQQTLFAEKKSVTDAVGYYSEEFFPVLRQEVHGFRDVVESLAVNITPLPTGSLLPYKIPAEIEGMFAGLDLFTSQALGGKLTNSGAQGGRQLPAVPAIAGCFGRVVIPSARWIRRAPGSKEAARVTVTTPSGQKVSVDGTLEVRAVAYTPYKNIKDVEVHKGYQIQVGNDLRDMDKVLIAHFTPGDALPGALADASGPLQLDTALETAAGEVLAQTKAAVIPVKVGDSNPLTVPYGTFTMSFTGGAGVRAK